MSNKTNIEEDIEILKYFIKEFELDIENSTDKTDITKPIENILADRERLEKENQESIPYYILYDFLITSVDETQKPIWTEEHINELLNNFIIKWKKEK